MDHSESSESSVCERERERRNVQFVQKVIREVFHSHPCKRLLPSSSFSDPCQL